MSNLLIQEADLNNSNNKYMKIFQWKINWFQMQDNSLLMHGDNNLEVIDTMEEIMMNMDLTKQWELKMQYCNKY